MKNKVLRAVVGIAVAVGALLAWKFWQLDGLLAFIIGAGGLSYAGIVI